MIYRVHNDNKTSIVAPHTPTQLTQNEEAKNESDSIHTHGAIKCSHAQKRNRTHKMK